MDNDNGTPKKKKKTPRQRFFDVAPKRVQKVLDAMDNLAKCGNPALYQYSEGDELFIKNTINARLRCLEGQLHKYVPPTKPSFRLPARIPPPAEQELQVSDD